MLIQLGKKCLSQVFLQRLQFEVKAFCNPLQSVLHLIYPNFVFQKPFKSFFRLFVAFLSFLAHKFMHFRKFLAYLFKVAFEHLRYHIDVFLPL